MEQTGPFISKFGLENHGFANLRAAHWNLSTPALYEHALRRGEGELAYGGGFVTVTGEYTGRSPKDKFIVDEPSSSGDIWWGPVNNRISEDHFDIVHKRMLAYFQGREIFVRDVFAGADPEHRLKVRVCTEQAWHSLFTGNMFITPPAEGMHEFEPDFTVLHAPNMHSIPEIDGTDSEVFVLLNFARKLVLVGGSHYTGEIKKTIFSVLNYLLPGKGVLPMHCSSNIGPNGDTAIFFGLSGTGKTTLSSEPTRTLIGDDEHGWSDNGTFNFEGGCYAKTISLSPEAEPEIFATTTKFATVIENMVFDPETLELDFEDSSLTENMRCAYPLDYISNASETSLGGQPKNVIMLTCDAYGVLPPIARLSPAQAMYHFLSGFTSKTPGTEVGVTEPIPTFSTCFGAPFMPRRPEVYGNLLRDKIAASGATCWLVNTGWTGGAYGVGERMKISYTRALLRAALEGNLDGAPVTHDNHFGLDVPEHCPEVPDALLDPRGTWSDQSAYDTQARDLVGRFHKNFVQFEEHVGSDVKDAAPHAA